MLLGYAGLLDVPETDEYAFGLREVSIKQPNSTGSHECFSMEIYADSSDSFPTVRLALLASLMMRFNFLLSSVLDASDVSEIY